MEDTDLTFGDVTDPYENDDPDRADGTFDMDTPNDPGPMPTSSMVECTVAKPGEHACGWNGRAGGTFDADSGVLELEFAPYSPEEMDPEDGPPFARTTTRFVEVERLLEVLAGLERFSTDDPISGEWWRTVLAEKLDARNL